MQTLKSDGTQPLPADQINILVAKYLRSDPVQCIENAEGCADSCGLRQALEQLEQLIVDLFNDHKVEAPHLSAPPIDDEILIQMAQASASENPVQFVRNHWKCASVSDILAALKEVREAHERIYNGLATAAGQLHVLSTIPAQGSAAPLAAEPEKQHITPVVGPTDKVSGWQPYATAPRDGSTVDLFYKKADGACGRVTDVRYLPAAQVNTKFGPGGCWESFAQDGWRHSVYDESTLVDIGFTHWRLVESDIPLDTDTADQAPR